jgi:hypothetical protein
MTKEILNPHQDGNQDRKLKHEKNAINRSKDCLIGTQPPIGRPCPHKTLPLTIDDEQNPGDQRADSCNNA